ncbi:hypothetical protein A9P82_01860 [Arachidicoccus ginsenosidimutans]|uniref:DUF2461 domain-containing protein n=1 Tax=Arachidicoccus sp. BS20 TaxID=1850526 RepID=UPI0007F07E6A|nr:DUF2461 domain-containing protein [Arachidicoccus sp. BS20]ANI88165.1 hypothetical protein A9P82_01860 [Arachidicoccus sp. BS20]
MSATIHKQTLQFLTALKKHNDRDWFHANKEKYDLAKGNFHQFVDAMLKELGKFEPYIAELNAKDCVFRINRDIRFSKDKSPYKTNFGALLSGKMNMAKSAYYLHIEPNGSFLAGGIHLPEPKVLKAIRQEIVYNSEAFSNIINEKIFKKYYALENEKLSKVPQGFDKEHPLAEYLKHKEMIAIHYVKDEDVLSEKFLSYAANALKALQPFNHFLNDAISDVS